MKKLLTTVALAAFALVPVGCNTSPEGGAPGTDNKFQLSGGTIPNAIKQGDTESVKVTLDRGKNFHQTVKLDAKAPDKIHATLDRTSVKDGESPDVNVKIHPADDAPAGDYKVTVTGTPDTGSPTSLELTVKVTQK
jgi:uncharacterized membrane protein